MKLSQVKKILESIENITFQLPDGTFVPPHFHVTEVGLLTKNFIDCGGTVRNESVINFQLWNANDLDHRLKPQKLSAIIQLSEQVLNIPDYEIEVEYQENTISKYNLEFNGSHFVLVNTQTACLAPDQCGIPLQKPRIKWSELQNQSSCCNPNSGCC